MSLESNISNWFQSIESGHNPSLDEAIQMLSKYIPALLQYKDTIQDPIWHAEGNVHIHTQMVLDELYKIFDSEFKPNPDQRLSLVLGAILHDIGKPMTTKEVDGRIKASRHEQVGRNYLVYRLYSIPKLSSSTIKTILGLVGYHQRPKLLVIKGSPDYEYIKLAQQCDTELIYWLEVADLRGRICEDLEESLMYLEEYKRKSEEILTNFANDCSHVRFETYAQNNDAKYLIANNIVNSIHEVIPYRYETMYKQEPFTFTVVCGIPGSGKSTLANKLSIDKTLINLDNIRAELGKNQQDFSNESQVLSIAKERLKHALRNRQNIVYDATNLRAESRNALLTMAHNYGAITKIYVLTGHIGRIIQQDRQRTFTVGEDVILKAIDRFECPEYMDASQLFFIDSQQISSY